MGQEQFAAIMPYISADLVGMIVKKKNISEPDAITKLYNSKLYAALEQEDTKVWQYSTDMLYSFLEQEERTGEIEFPDETGVRTKSWTDYAAKPRCCLYSIGLSPPRDSLIRLWLYQMI